MFNKYEEWINCNFGISLSDKMNGNTKPVSELIHLFSVMLLFGTFLVGIAESLSDHQVVIDGVKLLSYREGYSSTLATSGAAIIIGCIVGLLGLFLHIFLNKYSLKNYITNGFLIDAFLSILWGILYFIFDIVKGEERLKVVILATSIIAAIIAISYHFISIIAMRRNIGNNLILTIKKYKVHEFLIRLK